jgi:glycosyltransferase involved in cell wall biosynthesis
MTPAAPHHRLPRVLVVGHYASDRIGGEASIPLHMFRRLRDQDVPAWLVTHDSARSELVATLGADVSRVAFVPSLPGLGGLLPLGERLPVALRTVAWGITQLERQLAMLPVVRRLVTELDIDVVHQPISVSPTMASPLRRLGVPVVMGPLNGGMDMPPAFGDRDGWPNRLRKRAAPAVARVLNGVLRGRREAAVILVANERTRALLPVPVHGEVRSLSDIGVVLRDWPEPTEPVVSDRTRFCFVGRLVVLKGVDLLLRAFADVAASADVTLEVVGDGPERHRLERLAGELGVADRVTFTGWLDPAGCADALRRCDVFCFPSLQEAGGVVVLEAMASGRPVIAARWGGPVELADDTCAVLLDVSSVNGFTAELTAAMATLAADLVRRRELGRAGRTRVEREFDWDLLVRRSLEVYYDVAGLCSVIDPSADLTNPARAVRKPFTTDYSFRQWFDGGRPHVTWSDETRGTCSWGERQ